MTAPIIAILRGLRPDEAVGIGAVLVKAGITRIEVPLNSPDPLDSISRLQEAFGDVATLGAGTVLTVADVEAVANTGAGMIVSPNANPDVIRATKDRGLLSYPGVFSATECFSALAAGADGLKFFPAFLLGLEGLKALKAVLPANAETYMVGGVGPKDFAAYIGAGATGFGIGSAIYKPGMTAATVATLAEEIMAAARAV